ncbi:unnamed protein product [Polarella glacialis]|uniref:Uncharacterized protein n=1 Tax=Polarella glacialis TaxID=89957 RepID=A0A813LF94_POLGL|nr:unnamed protein product [Polarella glacialis]
MNCHPKLLLFFRCCRCCYCCCCCCFFAVVVVVVVVVNITLFAPHGAQSPRSCLLPDMALTLIPALTGLGLLFHCRCCCCGCCCCCCCYCCCCVCCCVCCCCCCCFTVGAFKSCDGSSHKGVRTIT